jgi:hypothetical protein
VETLTKEIMLDAQLMASHRSMRKVMTAQIEEVKKAIEEFSEIESSIPDSKFHKSAFINNNSTLAQSLSYRQNDILSESFSEQSRRVQFKEDEFF